MVAAAATLTEIYIDEGKDALTKNLWAMAKDAGKMQIILTGVQIGLGVEVSEMLNPSFWDAANDDWANGAWYTLADGTKRIKRFTYAMTRASLQDGAGANAMWNIPNVSRSDRPKLYTTTAWATAYAAGGTAFSHFT